MGSESRKETAQEQPLQNFEELTAKIRGNLADLEDEAKAMNQELQDAKAKTEGLGRRLLSDSPKPP